MSRGVDQDSTQVKQEMRQKHPQVADPLRPEGDVSAPPIHMSCSQVVKAVKRFKAGTATGPSGLCPKHLKEALLALAQQHSGRFSSSLTATVNLLGSG